MKKYNNTTNISLAMGVWLATDLYDHNDDPNTISATALIKPTKQIILGARVAPTDAIPDLITRVKSQAGTAVHTAVEQAWLTNYEQAMRDLGYPESVIRRIRLNPKSGTLNKDDLPIYLERRSDRTIAGMTISGKFDLVIEGEVIDVKNTSTYTYTKKTNDTNYKLQGSIYKWLNPDIITSDYITIEYVFSDWSALGYTKNKLKYPPQMQMPYRLQLFPNEVIEEYIHNKVTAIKTLWGSHENDLPRCTKTELWMDDSVFKYYKNPLKTSRSTRNFNNINDANVQLAEDGNVGVVKEIKAKAKACLYCPAFPVCEQRKEYHPT